MRKKKRVAIYKFTKCEVCPFIIMERAYTGDSFELLNKYRCGKKSRKLIGIFDWHEHTKEIPKWCPLI